jgi:hypothetical protein
MVQIFCAGFMQDPLLRACMDPPNFGGASVYECRSRASPIAEVPNSLSKPSTEVQNSDARSSEARS